MSSNVAEKALTNRNMQKLAAILFFAGLLMLLVHHVFLKSQSVFNDESWLVVIDSTHKLPDDKIIINLQPPFESQYIRHSGRNIRYTGLKYLPPASTVEYRRAIRLKAREPGNYQVVAEFSLQLSNQDHLQKKRPVTLSEKQLAYYLQPTEAGKVSEAELFSLLASKNLDNKTYSEIADEIFDYISGFTNREAQDVRGYGEILSSGYANQLEKMLLMVELGRYSGIPARLVTGIELKDDPSAVSRYWMEFFLEDRWKSYFIGSRQKGEVPYNFVALDKSGKGIISSSQPYPFEMDISIERNPLTLHGQDAKRGEWYQMLMFDRLPVETRERLALLMLLPLGTLLCSLIRKLLVIHCYGVFTPTILALALVYADTATTLLILCITLCLVYFGRPTFRGGMSRIPRLSIIFTLVACSMIVGVSILDYFNLSTDGELILLPIVIITSLLDRLFTTIESRGYHSALVRLAWTLILTAAVLPLVQLQSLGLWLLRYPEAHLITLSLILLISYSSLPSYKLPSWLGLLSEPVINSKKRANTREESVD